MWANFASISLSYREPYFGLFGSFWSLRVGYWATPMQNLTSHSCLMTPISYKCEEIWRLSRLVIEIPSLGYLEVLGVVTYLQRKIWRHIHKHTKKYKMHQIKFGEGALSPSWPKCVAQLVVARLIVAQLVCRPVDWRPYFPRSRFSVIPVLVYYRDKFIFFYRILLALLNSCVSNFILFIIRSKVFFCYLCTLLWCV